jgi:carbon-monoxide dehydrogenase small subunit
MEGLEAKMRLKFMLNGKQIRIEAPGGERLIDLLRDRLGLVGTKEGCGKGECGACTVLLNGEAVSSCLMLAAQVNGQVVTTIEGLCNNGNLHPIQAAFAETGAVQCGFCSPGMALSAVALLATSATPSRQEIRRALGGNLCRCTGYEKIFKAVESASRMLKQPARKHA